MQEDFLGSRTCEIAKCKGEIDCFTTLKTQLTAQNQGIMNEINVTREAIAIDVESKNKMNCENTCREKNLADLKVQVESSEAHKKSQDCQYDNLTNVLSQRTQATNERHVELVACEADMSVVKGQVLQFENQRTLLQSQDEKLVKENSDLHTRNEE